MANLRLTDPSRNALAQAFQELIDAGGSPGTIDIYTGPQPDHAAIAVAGQVLLGTLTFSAPSAPRAERGVLTFGPIDEEPSARARGKAAWARISDANGNTVFDCDVTETGGDGTIELNSVDIVPGGPIRITTFTLTVPSGAIATAGG